MSSRNHLGYVGFALALGAVGVVLGACSQQDLAEAGCAGSTSCEATFNTGGAGGKVADPLMTGGSGGAGVGGGIPPGGGGGGNGGNGGGYADAGEFGTIPIDLGTLSESCQNIDQVPRAVYMSADDSNSMGSPAHAREMINIGFEPDPARIRTYEFLNYYRIAYEPAPFDTLSIVPELEQKADNPAIAEFQIGVRSFDALIPRRPMNLTFLIDSSGSMKGPGLDRAKAAMHAIATQLVPGDKISLITSGSSLAELNGYVTVMPNDPTILSKVDGVTAGGTTNLSSALEVAYQIAKSHYHESLMNRVILISDGGVNAGVSDIDLIAKQSDDADQEGIYLIGVGTGPALSYNDELMNAITEAGRGAYVYLDSPAEADRVFTERFDETMDIAARNVQVELTLPWYFQVKGISTEEISEKPVTAQHLAPNDAMVFNLETTACDASLYAREDPVRIRVFWKTRVGYLDRMTEVMPSLQSLGATMSPRLPKGRAIVAYAEALKGCGFDKEGVNLCATETERKQVTKEKLAIARDLAQKADPSGKDSDLIEIISLIQKHPLF